MIWLGSGVHTCSHHLLGERTIVTEPQLLVVHATYAHVCVLCRCVYVCEERDAVGGGGDLRDLWLDRHPQMSSPHTPVLWRERNFHFSYITSSLWILVP